MSSENTAVYVHESRFPLRILKHLVKAGPAGVGSQVHRLDPLFRYEANAKDSTTTEGSSVEQLSSNQAGRTTASRSSDKGKGRESAQPLATPTGGGHAEEDRWDKSIGSDSSHTSEILTFESPIEGLVTQWCFPEGQLLRDPYQPILRVLEPCKHPVQLGGLCAVCGKDLTSVDYTGFRETSRASISMAHDTANLTVSLEEAARLEQQTTSRLRNERKLSLIVDLDQTIIHATVDPTVGEWMFDETNPNYPVLRDVQRFKLLNEDGKEEGCWYYVKPRPTLKHFLEEASKIYELHVYTMGTRQYAENVCRIIDPDGRMFANRILSRDESGSLVRKSLERLFPVDQSMVVIIDDRADIWEWSPHLVKVVPYDFFVGIGDINGAFLPKQRSALATSSKETTEVSATPLIEADRSKKELLTPAVTDENAAISEQNETLDHQIIDKPLARMQEEKTAALHGALDYAKSDASSASTPQCTAVTSNGAEVPPLQSVTPAISQSNGAQLHHDGLPKPSNIVRDEDLVSDSSDSGSDSDGDSDEEQSVQKSETIVTPGIAEQHPAAVPVNPAAAAPQLLSPSAPASVVSDAISIPAEEEAVLHDDDSELERVLDILGEIHQRFYASSDPSSGGVQSIIPRLKSEVLQGCNIVFSGVIPLDKAPETSEVWQLAEQFGATCSQDLSRRTTHVIAARKGTSKVNSAQRRRDISIVSLSWLLTSVNLWRRQPESAYTLDPGSPQGSDAASLRNDDGPSSQSGNPDDGEDEEDEDEEADLHDINWGDAEAEIQAFLDETDDEDSRLDSSHEDGTDGHVSEIELYSTSAESKKRQLGSSTGSRSGNEAATGSPLAKRRRVAAARVGQSKLKLSESVLSAKDGAESTADEAEDEDLDDFAKALEGELM